MFFLETEKVIKERNIRLFYATLKTLLKFVAEDNLANAPDPRDKIIGFSIKSQGLKTKSRISNSKSRKRNSRAKLNTTSSRDRSLRTRTDKGPPSTKKSVKSIKSRKKSLNVEIVSSPTNNISNSAIKKAVSVGTRKPRSPSNINVYMKPSDGGASASRTKTKKYSYLPFSQKTLKSSKSQFNQQKDLSSMTSLRKSIRNASINKSRGSSRNSRFSEKPNSTSSSVQRKNLLFQKRFATNMSKKGFTDNLKQFKTLGTPKPKEAVQSATGEPNRLFFKRKIMKDRSGVLNKKPNSPHSKRKVSPPSLSHKKDSMLFELNKGRVDY